MVPEKKLLPLKMWLEVIKGIVPVKFFCPLNVWLGVSKGMVPVKYFCPSNRISVSVKFHRGHKTHKFEINLATPNSCDMAGFETAASVSAGVLSEPN